ncbi:glycine betaine ABC transporter substrate-binding protein [Lacicoccus alkaliphilus]|uniref:glycine betaine ABC transporter substrate-binding protein n=1 Tax=Lacicoccus alkaliphilus TaxID=148453 RepID=UPI0015BF6406|nr:glycine betaine ABC transporter substrate-binding protein [Salinicoccus alkaliphilus]
MFNFNFMRFMLFGILFSSLVAGGCGTDRTEADDFSGGGPGLNYSEEMDFTITGVDLGAGHTAVINDATEAYDSLEGWQQDNASAAAMLAELDDAVENEEPIAVAAWSPHFKFSQYDLKYLEDPESIFGEGESMRTIVRTGLEEDLPGAYAILDSIQFEMETIEEAVLQGSDPASDHAQIAREWVAANQDAVEEWTSGAAPAEGVPVALVTTYRDDALFTANVAAAALSQHGFDVTLTVLDTLSLFEAISAGDADASLSPWLPITDETYYNEYSNQIDDLGPHTEGAKIGIAVPEYMSVDSLEDLAPKN